MTPDDQWPKPLDRKAAIREPFLKRDRRLLSGTVRCGSLGDTLDGLADNVFEVAGEGQERSTEERERQPLSGRGQRPCPGRAQPSILSIRVSMVSVTADSVSAACIALRRSSAAPPPRSVIAWAACSLTAG